MYTPGYFSDAQKEYVITDMRPKRPYENCIWNEEYLLNINSFGFGESFARISPKTRRYLFNKTDGARLIYIKNNSTGKYYDTTRNYSNVKFDKNECHVGIGYQGFVNECDGIRTEFTITVPSDGWAELWQIKVTNLTDNAVPLSIIPYCRPAVNYTSHLAYGRAKYEESLGGLHFYHNAFSVDHRYTSIYMKADRKPVAYELSDVNFLADYTTLAKPYAIENGLSCRGSSFDDIYCGAMQFDESLKAGESTVINIAIGIATDLADCIEKADKYLQSGLFEKTITDVKSEFDEIDNIYQLKTPDANINSLANTWLKRQISLGKTWGRIYGKGFRDIMQDVAGFVSFDNKMAKEKIMLCLKHQKYDGNSIRQFEPLMLHPYFDGAAWIPATVLAYIKESGDIGILDEVCPYFDNDTAETVLEHMYKGVRFLIDTKGEHGMTLWGGGDWNDSINNTGMLMRGESAWLSIATVKAITEFCEILKLSGKFTELIGELEKAKQTHKEAIINAAFEGDRFIYGITDWGEKVGSKENEQAQIYLNTQTWAVLADILDKDGSEIIMQSVEDYLRCPFGYRQCYPPYSKEDEHIGRMSYFVPGGFENGSVYNHGVAFKIAADCKLGKNDMAFETLKMVMQDNPANDKSGVEPYVFSNMYLGPENPDRPGYAPYAWITGTAGWMYRDITEYIVGVNAEFNGLRVTPCIPSHWDDIEVSRIYRGATYNIKIKRTGENKMLVDGKEISGDIAPVFEKGSVHSIERYI